MPPRKKISFSWKVCLLKAATSNKQWNVLIKSCKTPKYDDNLLSGSWTVTCGETWKYKQHIFLKLSFQKHQERWTNTDHTQYDISQSSKLPIHDLQQRSSIVCSQASRSFRHPKTSSYPPHYNALKLNTTAVFSIFSAAHTAQLI